MISIYTKPGCMQCKYTMRILNERGLAYAEFDVTTDDTARKVAEDSGRIELPYVVTDHDSWHGFKLDKLKDIPR